MIRQLAKRYAKAFYDSGYEHHALERIVDDLKKIDSLIGVTPQIVQFLGNPAVSSQKRRQILQGIFQEYFSADTFRFILFLNKKNRLNLLSQICRAFIDLYRKKQEILKVVIQSKISLTDREISKICERLKGRFQKNIEPECVIDSQMIGGIKIQVGDQIYDDRLCAQLEKFRERVIYA